MKAQRQGRLGKQGLGPSKQHQLACVQSGACEASRDRLTGLVSSCQGLIHPSLHAHGPTSVPTQVTGTGEE